MLTYCQNSEIKNYRNIDIRYPGTYEQEHGTALTRAEEKELLNKFYEAPHLRYRQAFIFIIYTGLRRS